MVSTPRLRASGSQAALRPDAPSTRLHYIDWLRVLAVLLLFPFHTLRVFDASDSFYVKAAHVSLPVMHLLNFISIWHMPLLFVLAGASTYFALSKRGAREYLRERRLRLLLPFVFGILVLIPPQTWYGGRFNSSYAGSFAHYIASGDFLKWNIRNGGDFYGGFGIGHLWFIMVLFLLSVIVLPLFSWGRKGRGAALLRDLSRRLARPTGWLLAALLIVVGAALPNPLGLKSLYYLVFFLLGYLAVCDGEFMQHAERYRLAALTAGLALATWWTLAGDRLHDSLPGGSLFAEPLFFLRSLAAWLVVVGLLGFGRRYLDRPSRLLAYLAEGSYPVYILQQTVIVVAAFYIVGLHAAEPLQWLTLLVISVAGTFALYEGVRRLPATRFLFGMRPIRKHAGEPKPFGRVAASSSVASSTNARS
jgi:glucans biosynthesis protein C